MSAHTHINSPFIASMAEGVASVVARLRSEILTRITKMEVRLLAIETRQDELEAEIHDYHPWSIPDLRSDWVSGSKLPEPTNDPGRRN